ncbi:glycine--tRNA ligase subunit beta, partial [uncultured Sphingobium sp.]|uniref:glycine--tRNA ligase subunit beta n=1 Tax=uncultured Sphingobium sp. TaxID=316087 RepID=UPI0026043A09
PLSGIVALLGDEVVECEVHGVTSGAVTLGHRFHHSGDITIGNAEDYAVKLRAAHVIVDHEERAALIREGAARVASEAGLSLVEDEGLVVENAGLTEWPMPLLGRFEEDFLEVPPETIQLTARVNQKYFVCEKDGKLADAFVCTANIAAVDGGEGIVAGNRKVLAARLSDARFFWEQDRKTPLSKQAEKLGRITFHEKLGTVADKVERVAKLAEWLATEGIVPNCDPALTRQAAQLCKADLVTEMVGEFPELQGIMGGYYARAEGLPDAVADAISDHYKPVGQGDKVPTAPVTVAVSLADKLDTLIAFFVIGQSPTGSRDPFALRRAAISVIGLILENRLRGSLDSILSVASAEVWTGFQALREWQDQAAVLAAFDNSSLSTAYRVDALEALLQEARLWASIRGDNEITSTLDQARTAPASVLDFFADRLKVQQKEAGVRHDLIDAVFALGGEDDLVRLLARVKALQSFVATDDGATLLAGYKRAANILKKESPPSVTPAKAGVSNGGEQTPEVPAFVGMSANYTPEPAEAALIAALDAAEPRAAQAVAEERFEDAMAALATLRAPIDAFFDSVTVNDPDPAKRASRLALLARVRDAVHNVADFSKIAG